MKFPLTISLLASNRITSLERCLDSLKPLFLQVPAELIVVFTGTDERVRQVAERYTDQIIPFTWCNDFSAARNAGLARARGEWFLYLDDDEWFDDVTEICEFFRSGEYQQYHYAGYVQRNYLNWQGSKHTDAVVYRMARRSPQLRFENPIHEELSPYRPPCKIFQTYVHHYGYLKDSVENKKGRASRNIPLLLEDIGKRPDYTKNYVQLAQEYCTESKWEQAEEMCRKGRGVCLKEEALLKSWLQVVLVEVLYKKEDYKQAEKEALLILDQEKPSELVCLLLFEFLIGIYGEWKDYEKLLGYGIKFEELLAYMERHPDLWMKQQMGTVSRDKVLYPEWLYPARLNSMRAALELGDQKEAQYFLELLPWEEEYRIQTYYPLLDHWKAVYEDQLPQMLAGLPQESSYLLYQRMLWEEQNESGEPEAALFLFRRCLKEIDQPYLQRQMVEKALREKKDLSPLLNRMDLESWKNCISVIVNDTAYGEDSYLWEAREELFAEHPLQGLWLWRLLLERMLTKGYLMKEALLQTLETYAECLRDFYQSQYQESMFHGDSRCLLPADCRMALTVLEGLEAWEQGNLAETIRRFREILKIYPRMTGVIREVLRLLKNEVEHPAPAAGAEFQQLAVQMKAALRGMIENGQYTEAMSVLSQLIPLLPGDMELVKMQQILLEKVRD